MTVKISVFTLYCRQLVFGNNGEKLQHIRLPNFCHERHCLKKEIYYKYIINVQSEENRTAHLMLV